MINYLIDSENIGTKWISYLDENIEELDKAFLFYTDASKSISCKELSVLFSFIHQLETIHCQNGTANALDFQLVSYLGYLIRMDTKSTYCILSKDKGYDVVVNFWKEKGIHIYRCEKFIEELELKQILLLLILILSKIFYLYQFLPKRKIFSLLWEVYCR